MPGCGGPGGLFMPGGGPGFTPGLGGIGRGGLCAPGGPPGRMCGGVCPGRGPGLGGIGRGAGPLAGPPRGGLGGGPGFAKAAPENISSTSMADIIFFIFPLLSRFSSCGSFIACFYISSVSLISTARGGTAKAAPDGDAAF